MNQQAPSLPKAIQDCHDLLAWIIPRLDQFPRLRRFTLGERIETGLLEILERLVEAAYSHNKVQTLTQANLRLDVVRHRWRLSHTLGAIPGKSYGHGAALFEDLGRQIGSWRRDAAARRR